MVMALSRVFGCALPAQTSEKQGSSFSPLQHDSGACSVSISSKSKNYVRKWVAVPRSPAPDKSPVGPPLADFKLISADVLKEDIRSKESPRLQRYIKLVDRLAAAGHLLEMAGLIAMLVDAGIDRLFFVPTVERSDVQSAIRAALRRGHLDSFVEFVRLLHTAGFFPLQFVDSGAMAMMPREYRQLLQQGEVDKCIQLLTTLSECGFGARRFLDVQEVIRACAKFRNVDAAIRYARLLPMVNLHYNFIMHAFSHHGDLESVFTAFSSMKESGIQPDMYSYRSLIDACAQQGEVAKAISVFEDILASGSIPNVYVYNSLMNVRAEDTDAVWQLYLDMQALGVEPDLATFNIMLKSCGLSKSYEKAKSLYQDMESHAASNSLKLDVFTYTTTIDILGDAKMWELALKVKEDMTASGVIPNVMTWTALIGACANVRMVDQAFSLFNEMWFAGCTPNEQTYNMLINACCKGSQYERAFQIFNEWKSSGQISAYRESELSESVSDRRSSAVEIGELDSDKETYLSPTAMKISSGMMPRLKPNLVTYNTLMKSCLDEPILAKQIMSDIVAAGLTPDLTSWSTYIDAYGSKGDLKEAINLFNNMKEEGILPDLVAYTSIIKASVKAGDADMAFEYFRELKGAGLRPNKVTYYTLFMAQRSFQKLCEVQRALSLYEEMRQAGYAPNDGILRVLLAQWAEIAIEDGGNGVKTARFSLKFQNEISAGFSEYLKIVLKRVRVHAQELEAEPDLMIDLHGLSRGEARVAVLAVLRIIKERHNQGYCVNDDLVIITGVGRRSEVPGLPIIRQTVLHVLEKELRLPVKFGSTNSPTIRKVPPQIFGEHHVHESGLEADHRTLDANCTSEESLSLDTSPVAGYRSSDTSMYTWKKSKSTDAVLARKPTNFGRLIVAKDALEEWLTRKDRMSATRSRVKGSDG